MRGDWLEEARRAARNVGEARPIDAARTRAKVARTLARRTRGRWRAPWIGLAAAALVGGTAWASGAAGARLVAWLRGDVSSAPARSVAATSQASIHATSRAPASVPREPEALRRKNETSEEAIASSSAPASEAPNSPARAVRSSDLPVPNKAVGRVEPPRLPRPDRGEGADSDARLYAEAHALHFVDHDPARALAAWDRYLAVAPDDTRAGLVLEARYNRAICLVRLGRREAARTALAPFASGAYGGYRRDEARTLLDAPVLRAPGASDDDSQR